MGLGLIESRARAMAKARTRIRWATTLNLTLIETPGIGPARATLKNIHIINTENQ